MLNYTLEGYPFTQHLDILLVEDNPINLKVAELMLNKLDHKTFSVYNGQESLEAIKKAQYDIIFMDVQMPLMDGIAATQKIREWESIHNLGRTKIIAMTANSLEEDKIRCINAGMDDFLCKPFSMSQLVNVIEKHAAVA